MDDRAPSPDNGDVTDLDAVREDRARRAAMPSRTWVRWWFYGLATVAAILVVLPIVSVLQPDYYRRYPGLGQRMDHWAVSTHAKITCVECHVEPGVNGFLSFASRSIPAFYSQLAEGPRTTNLFGPPRKAACQKCHTGYRSVSPGGDLLIPHRAHVDVLKMECVACHKDLVHSLNKRGYNRPDMETCLTCHNGDRATRECVKCHTRKQTPPSHAEKGWLQNHGAAADSKTCGTCHDWTPDYCAECHARRPSSHVGNWKKGHGAAAERRGQGCVVCHGGEKFCKRCH